MITKKGCSIDYLLDYRNGRIKQGLSIGCEMDKFIRHKRGEMNLILGHDNVGKTYFINYYFLALSIRNGLKFCIWSGENQSGQIVRDLIQWYSGIPFKQLSEFEIHSHYAYLEQYFQFIDNRKLYKPDELLELFKKSEADACLIDPFTGLDRDMGYEANYRFLNAARHFCNSTGIGLYINTHPNSEAGRSGNLYTDGDWKGHLKMPLKASVEGGKSFLNRVDNMWTVHRLVAHKEMRYYTMISSEKVKDFETGGKITPLNEPILADFNRGLGFTFGGVDPLKEYRPKRNLKQEIKLL